MYLRSIKILFIIIVYNSQLEDASKGFNLFTSTRVQNQNLLMQNKKKSRLCTKYTEHWPM